MGKSILTVLVMVVLGIVFIIVPYISGLNKDIHTQLKEIVAEANRNPEESIPTANGVRFDKLSIPKPLTLQYTYTFLNAVVTEMNVSETEVQLKTVLGDLLKAEQGIDIFRSNGVTIQYECKDKNGARMFTIEFLPGEY